ncbi:hypothetical protein ACFVMC_07905 [Nocardia sp. NPDC127579]|uniref:hypothetical protein n=1 Tax=Nocardia sp. NPDC127579 TaxID=3345402 RepID=UPI00362F57A5
MPEPDTSHPGSSGTDLQPIMFCSNQRRLSRERFWVYQVVDQRTDAFIDLGAMV